MADHGKMFGKIDDTDMEAGGGMRHNIDSLITERRGLIDQLASAVSDLTGGSSEFDDIFLLRFILTWERRGGLPKAVDACRHTIQWRVENKQLLDSVCLPGGKAPNEDKIMKFETVGPAGSLGGVEPIYCVRTGYCNVKGLMTTFSVQEISDWLHVIKERNYRVCDERTRKTRKLVKCITVVDMTNFSMFGGDKKFYEALGDSSKRAAVNYPQLLGKTVLINAPSFFRVLFGTFSVFMPQTFLDKMAFCPATGTSLANAQNASVCPFVRKFCGDNRSDIPTFLGGDMRSPDHLVPREECNSALTKVVLANRSKTTVEFEVPGDGFTAKWEVLVQDFGVGMSAVLVPSSGGAPIKVIQDCKVKADGGLAEGVVELPVKGTLQVTFDNTYSMFRGKTFQYRLDVIGEAASHKTQAPPKEDPVGNLADRVQAVVHM
mmetsp:Transcript_12151/g.30451  ORF Transcript_12151/g.30451 Transcript_12151/m.30451 type:complete len:433 (-) Transcript_12151:84-1382(-)